MHCLSVILFAIAALGVCSSFSISKTTVSTTSSIQLLSRGRMRTKIANSDDVSYCNWRGINESSHIVVTALRGGNSCANDGNTGDKDEEAEAAIKNPDDNNKTTPLSAAAYYLIWSPRFVRKLAFATIVLAMIRRFKWDVQLVKYIITATTIRGSSLSAAVDATTTALPALVSNILLPLLSSSCCAIQLAFNAVSVFVGAGVGCVGFNSILGPIRPYLLAVMMVYNTTTTINSNNALLQLLFRYSIAFMPELVYWWNELLRSRWRRKRIQKRIQIQQTT